MKILFLINSMKRGGGAERVIQTLSNSLSDNYSVTVYVFKKETDTYDLDEKVKLVEPSGKKSKYILHLFTLLQLLVQHKKERIISFLYMANIINVFFSQILNYKSVISERSFSYYNYKKRNLKNILIKRSIRFFYNKADCVVCISDQVKESLKENFGLKKNNMITIYNPIDIDIVSKQSNAPFGLNVDNKNTFIVVTVSRLIESKNIDFSVGVVASLIKEGYDILYYIVGDGPEMKKIKSLIKTLGVEKNIILLGNINNPFSVIKNADIFFFPTEYDAFGNVVLESMSIGVPVLINDKCGGPLEITKGDSYAFVYKKGDKEGCSNLIKTLLLDKSLLSNKKNKSEIRARSFEVEKIKYQYLNIWGKS